MIVINKILKSEDGKVLELEGFNDKIATTKDNKLLITSKDFIELQDFILGVYYS